jgi:hypothetical protein
MCSMCGWSKLDDETFRIDALKKMRLRESAARENGLESTARLWGKYAQHIEMHRPPTAPTTRPN